MNSKLQCEISFIIPVYNVEKYLEKCLDSIIGQRGIKREIIVIDDGSTDRSLSILKRYKKSYENVVLIQQEHQGASVARNKGIDLASGTWICFVDSDDYLEADCMHHILNAASEDFDLIFASYAKVRSNRKSEFNYSEWDLDLEKKDFERYQKAVLNKKHNPQNLQIITPWAKLYRTDFLKKNKIYFTQGIRKSQDLLFNFEVYLFAEKGKYIHTLMYYYRYNTESLCHKYLPGVLDDYLKQSQKIEYLLKKNRKYRKLEQDYFCRNVVNYMFSILLDYAHKDNKKRYKEREYEFQQSLRIENLARALKNVDRSEFTFTEKILLECIRKKQFFFVNFLIKGYWFLEKWK